MDFFGILILKKLSPQSQQTMTVIDFDFTNPRVNFYDKLMSGVPRHQEGICPSQVKKAEDPIIAKLSRNKVQGSTIFPARISFTLKPGFVRVEAGKSPFPISISFNFTERAFSSKLSPSALSFCQRPVW